MNETLVVGDPIPGERSVQAPPGATRVWRSAEAGDERPGSSAALARLLVELERELERERPARVLLADASDASLAAAIVAAKLLIPVERAAGIERDAGVNARLISQLGASYTEQR